MTYTLKNHGDLLEQEYSDFIQQNFKTYESVWKLYIGNKGDNTKADIPNFPIENDIKRESFSQHTYTILQSVILLSRLKDNSIFSKVTLHNIEEVLDLQDTLLLFFTHFGRIRDNVRDASKCLFKAPVSEITNQLEEFYHKRHILVHGKMIPLLITSDNNISIPILSKSTEDQSGWNHKFHTWSDAGSLPTENIGVTITQLYSELLAKLIHIFGQFEKIIITELSLGGFSLQFEYGQIPLNLEPSGSTSATPVDVYKLGSFKPI